MRDEPEAVSLEAQELISASVHRAEHASIVASWTHTATDALDRVPQLTCRTEGARAVLNCPSE